MRLFKCKPSNSVDYIDCQINMLDKLWESLTPEILNDFANKQPCGKYSDEYKSIKQLKDVDPSNIKLQQNCRLSEYPSYFDVTFPDYNANLHKGYIICEGPDPSKQNAIYHFITNVLMNKLRPKVDTIIVSGMPDDHFSYPYEHLLNYANYIPSEPGESLDGGGGYVILRKEPKKDLSTAGIEHICLEIMFAQNGITESKELEVFRFNKNPDLKRAKITEQDIPLMCNIALREPERIAFHCGAGLSRSVSKLLMIIIFKHLPYGISKCIKGGIVDTIGFLNSVANEFKQIRITRPGAIGNNDLLIEAIKLAIQVYKEKLVLQRGKINITNNKRSFNGSDSPRKHRSHMI